jgi:tetratricopeptide (TPR) repeat protein
MNDYEFWNELGKIFNAVVAYQEKAVEFNNRFINPWIRLGNVFDKQDRNQESIRAYEKALELDPANAQNWYELGNLYFREKGYEKAVEAYNKAIEFAPQSGWAYNNLALALVSQGKYAEALPLYQKGVDLIDDDRDKAMVWNRIGNVYRKLNEYDLAVQSFHRADELDAENAGFRDELDDVPESAIPAQNNADQDPEQASTENPNPIQLILSESQTEEKALAEAGNLPDITASSDANETELSSSEEVTQVVEQLDVTTSSDANEADPSSSKDVIQVVQQAEEDYQSRQQPNRFLQQQYRQRKNRFFQQRSYVRATVIASPEANNLPDDAALSDANPTQVSSLEDISQSVEQVIVEPAIVPNENTEDKKVLEIAAQPDNGEATQNALSADQPDQELVGDQQTTTVLIQDSSETFTEMPEMVTVTTTDTTNVVITSEEVDDLEIAKPQANENIIDESSIVKVELNVEDEAESTQSNVTEQSAYEVFLKENNDFVAKPEGESEDAMPEALQEPAAFVDSSGELQIEMDTKNAHVWNELGNIYFNSGTYDDAIVAYSKAIQLDRCFAWPYSNLALTYVQKGRFTEAILLYQRSIELFTSEKDKAISWNRLGNVYRRLNNYDSAIAAYQRADELDPENTTLSLQSRFSLLGNYPVDQQSSYVAG